MVDYIKKDEDIFRRGKSKNIDFIYNNSYEFENYIIAGTRGWNLISEGEEDKNKRKRAIKIRKFYKKWNRKVWKRQTNNSMYALSSFIKGL